MQRKLLTMLMLSAATTCALTASTRSHPPIEDSPHIESLEEYTKACERGMREAIERDVHVLNDRTTALAEETAHLESRKVEHQMRMMGDIADHAARLEEVAARKKARAENQLERALKKFQELQTRHSEQQARAEREKQEIEELIKHHIEQYNQYATEVQERQDHFKAELSDLTTKQEAARTAKNEADQRAQEAQTALDESTLEDNTELAKALDSAKHNSSEIASELQDITEKLAELEDELGELESASQNAASEHEREMEKLSQNLSGATEEIKRKEQQWTDYSKIAHDDLITLKKDHEATIEALKNAIQAAATAQETFESARKKEEAKRQAKRQAEQDAEEAMLEKAFWETLGTASQAATAGNNYNKEEAKKARAVAGDY